MQDDSDQVKLKLVQKPEGFELRDKRSDKSGQGADWLPVDALYSVQQRLADKNCSALMVVWREVNPDGTTSTCTRYAGDRTTKLDLLITALGKTMGWAS